MTQRGPSLSALWFQAPSASGWWCFQLWCRSGALSCTARWYRAWWHLGGNLVAFASKTLKRSEWSPGWEEALSLIFSITKFHKYLCGKSFTLYVEHQPLTTILGPKTGVLVLQLQGCNDGLCSWQHIYTPWSSGQPKLMWMQIVPVASARVACRWPTICSECVQCVTSTNVANHCFTVVAGYQTMDLSWSPGYLQIIAEWMVLSTLGFLPTTHLQMIWQNNLSSHLKFAMNKAEKDGLTISYYMASFLLSYRTMLHATTKVHSSVLFLGRSLRTDWISLKQTLQH